MATSRTLAAVVAMCLLPSGADAQSFWDRLIIRQNTDTKQSVPKPGFFHVTLPHNADPTYEVGLGVTFDAVASSLLMIGPSLEYLRNTTMDKPLDSLKIGIESEWQMREVDGSPQSAHSGIVLWRTRYSRDAVKSTRGLEASISYTHFFAGTGSAFRPNAAFGPGWLTLIYAPVGGFEVGQVFHASDGGDEGTVIRLVGQMDLALYPFGARLDNRLEASLSGALRSDIRNTTAEVDRTHPFGTTSVTYYFVRDEKRSMGVGVTYSRGDDPTKGLAAQRFWQLGFRVQSKQ